MKININSDQKIKLGNEELEEVNTFTYLGSEMTTDGGADRDVKVRIGKASYAFKTLSNIWKSNQIQTKTKLKIFNSNVKSVLLYGAETWKTSKAIVTKLQTFINKCLRRILKVYWPETIRNIDLWERTDQEPVEISMKRRKWRWIGHTLRKPANNITRQALDWNPSGTRKRGRPKHTWRRSVIKDLEKTEWSWSDVKREAQNRRRFRSLVEALCSPRSNRI